MNWATSPRFVPKGIEPTSPGRATGGTAGSGRLWVAAFALALLAASPAWAQAHRTPPAPIGVVENGAPPFSVIEAESIGLDSSPTDIELMPDGRLVVIATQEIAIGDGVRWEVIRQAYDDLPASSGAQGVVDPSGNIFLGAPGKGARVAFGNQGQWKLLRDASPANADEPRATVPAMVSDTGGEWYWYSTSGPVIAWHPGEQPRTVTVGNTLESVFSFKGSLFTSDRVMGVLTRIDSTSATQVQTMGSRSAITSVQPYDADALLVGTYGVGLQLFDGSRFRPFSTGSLFPAGNRINAVCATEGGMFAAAVDNFGIVFFNRDGRGIQVLDRSLDQRLSGVKKLIKGKGGVIWGLAEGSILRAQFPSRISHFEPLIGAGVTTVHPYRLNGRLWLMADGRIYRASYDADERLTGLEVNNPGQLFVGSLSIATGVPIAGTEEGAYSWDGRSWVPFAPSINNLRVVSDAPVNGRWLFGGDNVLGWLHMDKGSVVIDERIPTPGLNKIYNAVTEKSGHIWLELGAGKLGLIRFQDASPRLEILTEAQGLSSNWAQLFEIDGVVRYNLAEQVLRYDEASDHFLPDIDFENSVPGMGNIVGRPGVDALGRLWITANGVVNILEKKGGVWRSGAEALEVGFQPYYYTFEGNGVVWLHAMHRLARFDPNTPATPIVPVRAIITHLSLPGSSRTLYNEGSPLPPLDYTDNSLVAHFLATGNKFAVPVSFQVMLEGSYMEWSGVGSSGSASFNRLKEGSYVLRVRPVSGRTVGDEASLAFTIRPPWYRTPPAYATYIVAALLVLLLPVLLTRLLERRENARLERLVVERTREVSASNTRLASQVDEIRVLTQAVAQSPIAVYITTPGRIIEFSNPRASELTGYSPAELLGYDIRLLRAPGESARVYHQIEAAMQKGESWHGQLVTVHKDGRHIHFRTTISPMYNPDGEIRHRLVLEEDITEWLDEQQRGKRLEAQLVQVRKMESIGTLAGGIAHDFNNILTGILGYCELARMSVDDDNAIVPELEQIRSAGLRAKDLVMQILTFSRQGNAKLVPLDLARPVTEALKLIRASASVSVELSQDLESAMVLADATQIHQIVVNLCANSLHAMRDRRGRLEVSTKRVHVDERLAAETPNLKVGHYVRLTVSDNGHGMEQATLERIFDPFFTTKSQGEGTGLGLAIVQGVVVGHGGALRVNSRVGQGSTFDLYFPITEEEEAGAVPAADTPRGSGQRILLVEDEPTVSKFATSRLVQLGYTPVTFNDPRDALAAFGAAPGDFDVLITDLTMPHMTGLDLIAQVRPLRPDMPVVIFTGFGRELTREKLASIPRCVLLLKPFSGEELGRAVSLVLG